VTDLASHETSYGVVEREPPELLRDNLRVGSQLWSSATVFFFFAFLFAYFYLRSLNEHHLWRPKHVDPSFTLGTLVLLCMIGVAVLLRLAVVHHHAEELREWRQKGGLSLGLVVLALALQIAAWSTEGFGPTDGGYASVYLGWTAFEVLFLLGLLYWVETTLVTSLRYRRARPAQFGPGEASGDPHRAEPDVDDPLSLIRAELIAVSFFATVLAIVFAISWLVLYVL
jgi:heme/copper-type cytochrome/quinol oxidase subunit 3